MLAVAPTVPDTGKPLPKQLINNTLPEHGVNVIKNSNAYERNNYQTSPQDPKAVQRAVRHGYGDESLLSLGR